MKFISIEFTFNEDQNSCAAHIISRETQEYIAQDTRQKRPHN